MNMDDLFAMGFCKAAEEHGVDPVKLASTVFAKGPANIGEMRKVAWPWSREDPVVFLGNPATEYPGIFGVAKEMASDPRYKKEMSHWLMSLEDGGNSIAEHTSTSNPIDESKNPYWSNVARLAHEMRREKVKKLLLEIVHSDKKPEVRMATDDQVDFGKTIGGTKIDGLFYNDTPIGYRDVYEAYLANNKRK